MEINLEVYKKHLFITFLMEKILLLMIVITLILFHIFHLLNTNEEVAEF